MEATLSVHQQVNDKDVACVYIYIYNEILVIKKTEVLPFATMLMDLKNIRLIKVSQRKTNTECYLKIASENIK